MRDRLVALLNDLGFQPVFLPTTGLEPPELYNQDRGRLIRRGPLRRYLKARIPPPYTAALPDIEHQHTSRKRLSDATSFLHNALRCIGVGPAKLSLSFVGSDDLVLAFSEVTTARIDPSDLDPLLQQLEVHAIPDEYVTTGALHIAYEYVYARRVLLRRVDGKGFSAEVGGRLHEFFDLGARGKVAVVDGTALAFAASDGAPAAFGYKAGQLRLDSGKWAFYPEVVSSERGEDSTAVQTPYLPARGVVLMGVDDGEP
jgi:hypothetical protein